MATGATPTIPPSASAPLDAFRQALESVAGDNLVCLAVYGSAARDRYDPESSDLNVAVVLTNAGGPAVLRIAQVLHDAQRASRIEPIIFAERELSRLAVSFPTKILDIQRRHTMLSGRDVFTGIRVAPDDLRQRVEQELRNIALRLRRRLAAARTDPRALGMAADDAAAALAVNLRALLLLHDKVPDDFQPMLAIFESAATEFGLDAAVLDKVKQIHRNAEYAMTADELARLIDTVSRAADVAANTTSE